MSFFESITFRRKRTSSDTNQGDISSEDALDGTTSSLPDISEDEQTIKLKQQIESLVLQLKKANNDIESLRIENKNLKQLNDELEKNNELLKKSTQTNSTTKRSKKNKKNKQKSDTTKEILPDKDVTNTTLETTMSENETEIKQNILQKVPKPLTYLPDIENNASSSDKPKLCIISSNKINNLLLTAEDTFDDFQVCHYLTPNSGLTVLLRNIEDKLKLFTKRDYCVILPGESDFLNTTNYHKLTSCIRNKLKELQHTNIIVCTAVFRCNNYSTLFNQRVKFLITYCTQI